MTSSYFRCCKLRRQKVRYYFQSIVLNTSWSFLASVQKAIYFRSRSKPNKLLAKSFETLRRHEIPIKTRTVVMNSSIQYSITERISKKKMLNARTLHAFCIQCITRITVQ